ncbi:MAG: GNAT family N-acetyltransferase [Candidatus Dormiibacterota bacterium]
MEVHGTASLDEYATAVTRFLEEDPCARNVLLSVIDSVRVASSAYSAPPSFWWVDQSGSVIGASSWTPPYQILVSSMPVAAAPAMAAAMIARASALGIDPGGINGPEVAAGAVAAAWAAVTGDIIERERVILLNELGRLVDVPIPPGGSRKASPDDVPLIAGWLRAFGAEVDVVVGANPRAIAERAVDAGGFDLWIDGGMPVCLVGHRIAAHVLRVGPVYTPPEHRNRGYGRRLTYEVTAMALARPDVTRAMLFTDAANPVSNSIYRQAGYEPRDRHVEIEFAERTVERGH